MAHNIGRRDYGYINGTIYGVSYPMTAVNLANHNATEGARHLVDNFDSTYTRCFADVLITPRGDSSPNQGATRIGFRSLDNLVEWINNNVPNDGASFTRACRIRIYDEVDESIPPIRKLYGKNTRKASLIGHMWYYHGNVKATGDGWDGAAAFLADVWTNVVGTAMPAPGTWTPDEFACFWFTGSRRTYYACPSPSLMEVRVNPAGAQGRKMRQLSDGARVDASSGMWQVGDTVMVVLNSKDGSFIDYQIPGIGNYVMHGWSNDNTVMVAYPMVDGSGNQSVVLKPLGVDSFFFNWFDPSRYQLEMLSSRGPQFSWPRLCVLDTSAAYKYPEGDSLGPIELGPMMETAVNPKKFGNRRYKPADMYFQLRDLRTNRVSTVSPQRVSWVMHRGSAIVAPLVRTRAMT